jgi:Skp family chaperone for outer membrane proteins
MAHDVFISHSSKDKLTADAVCAVLESKGIRCWVAPRDVLLGSDWSGSIIAAIKGARVMVLVFSGHANESPHIGVEVERAASRRIPIIPIRIEHVAPTESLEYFLSTRHWLDAYTPPLDKHLEHLATVVAQILALHSAGGVTSSPVAPPPAIKSEIDEPLRGKSDTDPIQPRVTIVTTYKAAEQSIPPTVDKPAEESFAFVAEPHPTPETTPKAAEERPDAVEAPPAELGTADLPKTPVANPIGALGAGTPPNSLQSKTMPQVPGMRGSRPGLWLAAATAILLLAGLVYNFGVYQPEQQRQREAEQSRIAEANRLADEKRAADAEAAAAAEKSAADEKARLANAPGGLNIDSDPRGADVFQGDKKLGVTPYVVSGVTPGHYVLTLKLDKYKNADLPVDVAAQQTTSQAITLEREAYAAETPAPAVANSATATSADKTGDSVGPAGEGSKLTAAEMQRITDQRAAIAAQRYSLGLMGVLDQTGSTLIGTPLVIYASPDLVLSPGYVALKPGIVLATVDLAKLFDGDADTKAEQSELQADEAKAQEKLSQINSEGNALVEQYKELLDMSKNPTSTAEARADAQEQARKKYDEIQREKTEQSSFVADAKASLQKRFQTYKASKVAELIRQETERAAAVHGGSIVVLDISGPSLIGISPVIYSDPSFGADPDAPRPQVSLSVVDVAKLYDGYWKTQEQQVKISADEAKAKEELDQITKDGNALVEQYKELDEQAKDPTATADSRAAAQNRLQVKLDEIQKKRDEQQAFVKNTHDSIAQRLQAFKTTTIGEITKAAVEVAKGKAYNLLIDKSGPALNNGAFPFLVASDGGLEITDEVMKEINRDRP